MKLLVVARGISRAALTPLYAATVERQHAEAVTWRETKVVPFLLGRSDALVHLKGRTNEVAPIDLTGEPDLAEVLSRIQTDLNE